MKTTNHKTGKLCLVEIHNSKTNSSDFVPGKITGTASADDRDYRVNVILNDGRELHGCAPECVLVK